MKKIRTTNFNVSVERGIYIDIDDYRFLLDEGYPFARVELIGSEAHDFLDEFECNCTNHKDLECAGLNWIFNNVEIVKEV